MLYILAILTTSLANHTTLTSHETQAFLIMDKLILATALMSSRAFATVLSLADVNTNGAVPVETVSTSKALLDGPKITATANDTTYDW